MLKEYTLSIIATAIILPGVIYAIYKGIQEIKKLDDQSKD